MVAPINVDNDIGCWLLGGMFSAYLSGIVQSQTWHYYQNCAGDKIYMKLLVFFMWTLSFSNFVVLIPVMWHYLLDSRTDVALIFAKPTAQMYQTIAPTVAQYVAQIFFSVRAFRVMNKNIYVGIFLGIITTYCFGIGLADFALTVTIGQAVTATKIASILAKYVPVADAWTWSSVGVDAIISMILCYKFRSDMRGFNERTDDMLTRLVRLSVTTAALTVVVTAITGIVAETTISKNNYFLVPFLQMVHIYAISVIYTMNQRHTIRDKWASSGVSNSFGSSRPGTGNKSSSSNIPNSPNFVHLNGGSVQVSVDKVVITDDQESFHSTRNLNEKVHALAYNDQSQLELGSLESGLEKHRR